jgi:hypothetical protein
MKNHELLEALQDARARREVDYQYEKLRIGNGGSQIAMGQARRDADAIAIAAIRISGSATNADSGPRWYHWGILAACVVVTIVMVLLGV